MPDWYKAKFFFIFVLLFVILTISTSSTTLKLTKVSQQRITGTCIGEVMVQINEDGTVVCETDNEGAGSSAVVITLENISNRTSWDMILNIPAYSNFTLENVSNKTAWENLLNVPAYSSFTLENVSNKSIKPDNSSIIFYWNTTWRDEASGGSGSQFTLENVSNRTSWDMLVNVPAYSSFTIENVSNQSIKPDNSSIIFYWNTTWRDESLADTSAATECEGDTVYYSGEGNCNNLDEVYWDACEDAYACNWLDDTTEFGGEVSGTYDNIVLDDNALDDQYYDAEEDLTTLLDDNYLSIDTEYIEPDNSSIIFYWNTTWRDEASGSTVVITMDNISNYTEYIDELELDNKTILRINNLSDISKYINLTINTSYAYVKIAGDTMTGGLIMDDNAGDSPHLQFMDGSDEYLNMFKDEDAGFWFQLYGDRGNPFYMDLFDEDASGSTNDYGQLVFGLEDDGDGIFRGSGFRWTLTDASDGAEDMDLSIWTAEDGLPQERFLIGANGNTLLNVKANITGNFSVAEILLVDNTSNFVNIDGTLNATKLNGTLDCTMIAGGSDADFCADADSGVGSGFNNWTDINVSKLNVNNTLFVNDSWVGIGTSSPKGILHIVPPDGQVGRFYITTNNKDAHFLFYDNADPQYLFGYDYSEDAFRIYSYDASINAFKVQNSGLVNITRNLTVWNNQSWTNLKDCDVVATDSNGVPYCDVDNDDTFIYDDSNITVALNHSIGNLSVANDTFYVDNNSGSVGIGTINPETELHVWDKSTSGIQVETESTTKDTYIALKQAGSWKANYGWDDSDNVVKLSYGGFISGNTYGISINTEGKVGVGTVRQAHSLTINDSLNVSDILLIEDNKYRVNATEIIMNTTNGNMYINAPLQIIHTTPPIFSRTLTGSGGWSTPQAAGMFGIGGDRPTDDGAGASFLFFANNDASEQIYLGRVTGIVEDASDGSENGAIAFMVREDEDDTTAATEVMRITSSGNVGIGETNPNSYLEIDQTGGTDGDFVHLRDDSTARDFYIHYEGTTDDFQFRSEGSEGGNLWFHFDNDGPIGIGTTTPTYALEMGTSDDFWVTDGSICIENAGGTDCSGSTDGYVYADDYIEHTHYWDVNTMGSALDEITKHEGILSVDNIMKPDYSTFMEGVKVTGYKWTANLSDSLDETYLTEEEFYNSLSEEDKSLVVISEGISIGGRASQNEQAIKELLAYIQELELRIEELEKSK